MEEIASAVSALGNILMACAAIAAAIAAFLGLNAWKREQAFRRDHDLAMSVYSGFRKRRQIFHYIRSPYLDRPLIEDVNLEEKIKADRNAPATAANKMLYWSAIKDTEIIQAALFDEAKLRWGLDFFKLSAPIRDLEYELAWALGDAIEAENGKFNPDEAATAEIDAITDSMHDKSGRREAYDRTFSEIVAVLKSKMF